MENDRSGAQGKFEAVALFGPAMVGPGEPPTGGAEIRGRCSVRAHGRPDFSHSRHPVAMSPSWIETSKSKAEDLNLLSNIDFEKSEPSCELQISFKSEFKFLKILSDFNF